MNIKYLKAQYELGLQDQKSEQEKIQQTKDKIKEQFLDYCKNCFSEIVNRRFDDILGQILRISPNINPIYLIIQPYIEVMIENHSEITYEVSILIHYKDGNKTINLENEQDRYAFASETIDTENKNLVTEYMNLFEDISPMQEDLITIFNQVLTEYGLTINPTQTHINIQYPINLVVEKRIEVTMFYEVYNPVLGQK